MVWKVGLGSDAFGQAKGEAAEAEAELRADLIEHCLLEYRSPFLHALVVHL
jgi:hypothetical protein